MSERSPVLQVERKGWPRRNEVLSLPTRNGLQ
jgi:hypothetical protein